jgi:hypothetical protein
MKRRVRPIAPARRSFDVSRKSTGYVGVGIDRGGLRPSGRASRGPAGLHPPYRPFDFAGTASVKCPTGKSPKSCPAPFAKIFPFAADPNQIYNPRRSVPRRGVGHRHERWDGMRWTRQRRARTEIAGRASACERSARADERRFCVRQNRVVLAPVAGVKSAEVFAGPTGFTQNR